MATDYKIVVVPDTGGTRPCIECPQVECPQCLGLQLLFVSSGQATKVLISKYLATRRVVVSVDEVNASERQLLTSLIHAP